MNMNVAGSVGGITIWAMAEENPPRLTCKQLGEIAEAEIEAAFHGDKYRKAAEGGFAIGARRNHQCRKPPPESKSARRGGDTTTSLIALSSAPFVPRRVSQSDDRVN